VRHISLTQDYIHACDRLSLLKFTEIQQREFVRVALHCAATEKVYNPYHTLIINHLCSESYSHRFTLQYALWDFLRELGDSSTRDIKSRCANVAKTAAYIVGRKSLDLTVYKVSDCRKDLSDNQGIDFTDLKPPGIYFFSVFLSRLFLATQTPSPIFALSKSYRELDIEAIEETFEKALPNRELAQGLSWVLQRKGCLEHDNGQLSEMARSVVANGATAGLEVLSRVV
jgi:nucleolar MIF4G domain-containing protein 1